jgi:hypothetical protein
MKHKKRGIYIFLNKIKHVLLEEIKANDWIIDLRYFTIIALTPAVAIALIVWPFNDIELMHNFILTFSISSLLWAINVSFTSNEWRKRNIKDILACLDPLDEVLEAVFRSNRLLYTTLKNEIVLKYKLNLRDFVIISMIQRVHMLFTGFVISIFIIYHFMTYPPPASAPASTQMAHVFMPALFNFSLWIFFFWSFAADLKTNYCNTFSVSIKTKIITIMFVAGFSLFIFTALFSLALFITARISIFYF